jgi:hypothetical protein
MTAAREPRLKRLPRKRRGLRLRPRETSSITEDPAPALALEPVRLL